MKKTVSFILLLLTVISIFAVDPKDVFATLSQENKNLDDNYSILKKDVELMYNQQISAIQQSQQDFDPAYDGIIAKSYFFKNLFNQKLLKFYAEKNNLLPQKSDIDKQMKVFIDNQITQVKSNMQSWANVLKTYGGEDKFRQFLETTYRSDIENSIVTSKVVNIVAPVSNEEIRKFITDNFDSLKTQVEQVKARHILFALTDEATALKVRNDIISGKLTFEDAAKKYSKDTSNAGKGGDLGWFGKNMMVKEFETASFSANLNEITLPVKTQFGFHLIKVEEKKNASSVEDILKMDDIVVKIKNNLSNKKLSDWFIKYSAEQNIKINFTDKVYEYAYFLVNTNQNQTDYEIYITEKFEKSIFDKDSNIIPNTSNDMLILYMNGTDTLKNYYLNIGVNLQTYLNLRETIDATMASIPLDTLTANYNEKAAKFQKDQSDQALYGELMLLQANIAFQKSVVTLSQAGIKLDDASVILDDVNKKFENLLNNRIKCFKILYKAYPNSEKIITMYYSEDRTNSEIKFTYAKFILNQMKQLSSQYNKSQVINYFADKLQQIGADLSGIIDNIQLDNKVRITAAETGFSIASFLDNYEMQLEYLENIKLIEPSYKNIDKKIADVKSKIK